MVFKVDWEKSHAIHNLDEDHILQMIALVYPESKVAKYEIIAGGCANINVKFKIVGIDCALILRVYLRNQHSAFIEQKLGQKLSNKVPLPKILQISKLNGYVFSMAEFISGITLRDLLLSDRIFNLDKIMFQVGNVLATIASIEFTDSGFFNENLKITSKIFANEFMDFGIQILEDEFVHSVLSSKQCHKLSKLIENNSHLFLYDVDKNLVHADFDPSNILVHEVSDNWEISGILDWEFSFSGSTLFDVANMLRYSHHMPNSYEKSFLSGLKVGGYTLPDNWRIKVHMLNLVSLLDCLKRSNQDTPRRIEDICKLIDYISSLV